MFNFIKKIFKSIFGAKTSERDLVRDRYIYALLFFNDCCYIGQSVDTNRRLREHILKSGWDKKFVMLKLDKVKGTYYDAEDYEYAWRACAQKNGWKIYGLPPDVIVDPSRRMNAKRNKILSKLIWPKIATLRKRKIRKFFSWLFFLGALVGIGYTFLFLI